MGLNKPLPQYMFLFALILIVLTGIGFIRLILAIQNQMVEADAARAAAHEVVIPK